MPACFVDQCTTKPFCGAHEGVRKPTSFINSLDQQRGSVMWAFIIDLIYHQSCQSYLTDLARHQHRWI
jgi:hypothetical protein